MVCIYCGAPTQVKNSRLKRRSNHIWRRRACNDCGSVFTTEESPELAALLLVRGGPSSKLAPFSRDRLFLSIYRSCEHRPTALSDATNLTQTVIAIVGGNHSAEAIETTTIAKMVYDTLKPFDALAANLYAVYHNLPATS